MPNIDTVSVNAFCSGLQNNGIGDDVHHGGDLRRATETFGNPVSGWLDLSTGISPWVYPVPPLPEDIWHRLPYNQDALIKAAADYYACSMHHVTAVPGSQTAIRNIPTLLSAATVALPLLGYQEHRYAWEKAGHKIVVYQSYQELLDLLIVQPEMHVIVINPNNPTGELWDALQLKAIGERLAEGFHLIVDEAFMDIVSSPMLFSAAPLITDHEQILVLRSIGKFFGLAGLRLGFVLGNNILAKKLYKELNPWGVSHPAIWLGEKALSDKVWQREQKRRLSGQSEQLVSLLKESRYVTHASSRITSTDLFLTLTGCADSLHHLYTDAAKQGILFRYERIKGHYDNGKEMAWLRMGLPGKDWSRLSAYVESKEVVNV
jgi:cobalamin biosynthetic protein CobC